MTLIRWTPHAVAQLGDRDIDPIEAERTLAALEFELLDAECRRVCMPHYFDARLGRQMLLRVVVEETSIERG